MTAQEHPQFKSKAQREQESDLRAKYRELGNPELVEVLKQQKKTQRRAAQAQMTAALPESD
ncbi:MAG: hypothetical protein J0H54_07020 [Rhizobiales bacterium]|nr:hypothetical protein [Hyphomicrobiales bacterium]